MIRTFFEALEILYKNVSDTFSRRMSRFKDTHNGLNIQFLARCMYASFLAHILLPVDPRRRIIRTLFEALEILYKIVPNTFHRRMNRSRDTHKGSNIGISSALHVRIVFGSYLTFG